MVGTILITWTLFVCTAGMPEKSKVALSGIASREQCANVARRVGFSEREFACAEDLLYNLRSYTGFQG